MKRFGLDSMPPVTEDEALELCVHHLQLASIYFMNMSENIKENLAEAERIIQRDCPSFKDNPHLLGAKAFLQVSHDAHEAQK